MARREGVTYLVKFEDAYLVANGSILTLHLIDAARFSSIEAARSLARTKKYSRIVCRYFVQAKRE